MSETSSSGGVGIFTIAFVVLLVLKLAKVAPVASWSWVMVTSPLWGGILAVLIITVLAILWQMLWA